MDTGVKFKKGFHGGRRSKLRPKEQSRVDQMRRGEESPLRAQHEKGPDFWGIKVAHGLPWCSDGEESTCSEGDLGSIPGLGRSSGAGHGNTLHCSCLENPHEQRNLAGYGLWGCKELDMTEQLSTAQHKGAHRSFTTPPTERWNSLLPWNLG